MKKNGIINFFLLISLWGIPNVLLCAYNLRKITNAENLLSSNITSIYQDKKGVMWIGTNNGLNIYDGKTVSEFHSADNNPALIGNRIEKILETDENTLWIQTFYGLIKIDRGMNTIRTFNTFDRVSFSARDSKNNLFIIQGNSSIYYYMKNRDAFDKIYIQGLVSNEILHFFIDKNDKIWIFKTNGNILCFSILYENNEEIRLQQEKAWNHSSGLIYCLNDDKYTFLIDKNYKFYRIDNVTHQYVFLQELKGLIGSNMNIASVIRFHNDFLFSFKTDGLFILKENQNHYSFEKIPVNSGISCLLRDKHQDIIWVGTEGQGVYTYSLDPYSINEIRFSDLALNIKKQATALFLDKDNTLWIGSNGDGILKIYNYNNNRNSPDFQTEIQSTSNSLLQDNSIYSFSKSRHDILWIGNGNGIDYFSYPEKEIKKAALSDENNIPIKYVHDIYEQDSILWVASSGMGIVKAQIQWSGNTPSLKVVRKYTIKKEDFSSNRFTSIFSENDTILWFTNRGEGAFRLNTATDKLKIVRFEGSALNEINTLVKYERNGYWMGTNFGLVKHTPDSLFIHNETNGFPNNTIHSILKESEDSYWLGTNRGIVLYNPDKESYKIFNHQNGLSVTEFCDNAAFRDEKSGTVFFGGINGLVSINRNDYDEGKDYMPPIYFDKLTIFGKEYNKNEFIVRKKDSETLELNHNQNFFSVSFIAPDYITGNNHTYFYKLDGRNKQWVDNGNSGNISFTNFPLGEYRLFIKYYNKIQNKDSYIYSLKIRILPPWYQSQWAYAAYIILIASSIYLIIKSLSIRNRRKKEQMLQKIEQKHKEEIYEGKLQFFTNIAHEFCTPLTLIYGPCEQILGYRNIDPFVIRYTEIIRQNAKRLNTLIQDLMEFKRIETGYEKPRINQLQLSSITNQAIDLFAELAEAQNIRLVRHVAPGIRWNSDKKFIITIITNLISNAFKYTTKEGVIHIMMNTADDNLHITVSNTGKGIRKEDIQYIFNRHTILHDFEYQSSWSRNGLGLAILRGMIDLLNGTLEVESIPNEWTHFKVKLPSLEADPNENTKQSSFVMDDLKPDNIRMNLPRYVSGIDSRPTILIIDDEQEILWFISEIFTNDFNVIPVMDPAEVARILEETHPDIILCDMMMKKTDGISLIKELKSEEKTAHIPLIIISALHEIEKQIEAMDSGAEMYITKPFNVEYLKASVKRLLERKDVLKDYFASPLSAFELINGKLTHKDHKKLMNSILNIINKNIQNKKLSVNLIAEELNMSSRSFYRKIKEIGDISITDLIRDCRLDKAVELLLKSKLTTDEIIFKSGFMNRASFYRAFNEKFRCTPGEYKKQYQNTVH